MASTVPHTRVVISSHSPSTNKSTFTSDSLVPPFHPFGPQVSALTTLHSLPSVPTSNLLPISDTSNTLPKCPPAGVLCSVVDFAPAAKAPMHRTLSLDYIVIMTGEIVAVLDGGEGEERVLKVGDVMIQRGTNHSWENRSTEWCKMMVVMVGAEPLKDGEGNVLEDTQFGSRK